MHPKFIKKPEIPVIDLINKFLRVPGGSEEVEQGSGQMRATGGCKRSQAVELIPFNQFGESLHSQQPPG